MKKLRIKYLALSAFLMAAVVGVPGQKPTKPWTEWSKNDVKKMLDDSPWAQIQTETDTSEMFFQPTAPGGRGATGGARSAEGAVNSAVNVKFHVRIFSARPIRQALARTIELEQKPGPEVVERLHSFADLKAAESIIITVTFESPDGRYSGVVMQAFNSAVTATMKNDTYLERGDGQRIFLEEYVPPGKDGFGARFIFLRAKNGQPFLDSKSGEVRFSAKYPVGIRINRRFKVADMIYNGELEY